MALDAYRALVVRAFQHGLPVAGHLPVGIGAAEAALACQRRIEHLGSACFHGLLLASSSEEGPLTGRVQAVLEAARQGDAAADARLFLGRPHRTAGGFFQPTEGGGVVPHVGRPWHGTGADARGGAQADGITEQDRLAADRVWDRYREMVRPMHDAGVLILTGTDQAADGASLHREVELLVEVGSPRRKR